MIVLLLDGVKDKQPNVDVGLIVTCSRLGRRIDELQKAV